MKKLRNPSLLPLHSSIVVLRNEMQCLRFSSPSKQNQIHAATTHTLGVLIHSNRQHSMAKALSSKHPHQNAAVLQCLVLMLVLLLFAAIAFVFWPSDPHVQIVGMNVARVKVHPVPPVTAEVRISVSVKIRNGDIYWMDLSEVDVGLKYRGRKLGHVESKGWHVRGWGWCRVSGEIDFNGLPAPDVVHLLEDMAKGRVHLHAVVEVTGLLGLAFYRFTRSEFKTVSACEILVNTKDHSIIDQHCIIKD